MRRRSLHRLGSGGGVALLFALASVVPFLAGTVAHARTGPSYEDSEPGNGSSVQSPPAIVRATFSEPLDDSSSLAVFNECGQRLDAGNTSVNLDEMSVDVAVRHWSGTHTVKYTAVGLGKITGTSKGSFSFEVAEGHSCGSSDDDDKHGHGDKDDKKHEHGDGGGGNDHDGHGGGTGNDHQMSGHTGMSGHTDHSAAGSNHGSHDMKAGAGDQGQGHGNHKGANSGDNGGDPHEGHGSPNGTFASDPLPQLPADGRAVVIALALCAGMGIIGGTFLRASVH